MSKRDEDWFVDLRSLPGEAGEVMRAALGPNKTELEKAFDYEARHAPRPGVFTHKLGRKKG